MQQIGLLVFSMSSRPVLQQSIPQIIAAVGRAGQETYLGLNVPRPTLNHPPTPRTC